MAARRRCRGRVRGRGHGRERGARPLPRRGLRRLTVFADTSALYALLNRRDRFHVDAARAWSRLRKRGEGIQTSNYVVVETTALLQTRIGVEPVRALHEGLLPVIRVVWVDAELQDSAFTALLAARRLAVSLVDHVSFATMRRFGLRLAFSFDRHFEDEGFELVAG